MCDINCNPLSLCVWYDYRYVVLTTIDNRPNMVWMEQCTNTLIWQLSFKNSPMYHLYLNDMANVTVRDLDIHVDIEKQKEILATGGWLSPEGIPMFPLNTDGIDPSGINILIENVTITNYDDAVAVKPNNGGSAMSPCTENVLVRNVQVNVGVGMSIGSVPPDPLVNWYVHENTRPSNAKASLTHWPMRLL